MIDRDDLRGRLQEALPVVFPRSRVDKLTGYLVAPGTVRNAMWAGTGPDGTFAHGHKVMLSREEFLDWLIPRLTCDK